MRHPLRTRPGIRAAAFRPLLIALATAFFALAGAAIVPAQEPARTDDPAARRREFYENLKILGDVYERVINNYVDEMDPHEVMEGAVNGMLELLDEHSNYLPPVNYEDLMTSTEGEFGGLGISINIRDHYPTVVSPIEGTPAYYMGIQGGDQIIEIEGESSRDMTSRDAVKLLRGTPGTKVNIAIQRPGREDPIPLTITRDVIKLESVPYGFMMGDVGYIRIQNFARTTREELKTKLDELTARNMRGLILDLRFNPGGLLESAQGVSELFLERDKLIVFTQGRLRSQNQQFFSQARGKVYNQVPLIVLINGSSASASEIVSAAIQDHDAGLVVGQTSFGKGSVQTVFRLDEDEALKLTTARYYTPSGRSIHKDRPRNPHDGELAFDDDGEPVADPEPLDKPAAEKEVERFQKEKYYTDSGRVVYGGGGITPDIEIDQDFLTDFEVAVERDGALFSFAVDLAARLDSIPEDFNVSEQVFRDFGTFLKGRENIDEYLGVFDLTMSDSLLEANREFIDRGIRREVARRGFGQEAAYRVAIEADVQLHHALELFSKARTLPELLALAEEWNNEQMKQLAAETPPADEGAVSN
ncbi:S41 family peptidase [bacterium]|nr:S41 family peptidase [bacterium]